MNDARITVGSYRHHSGDRPHYWCAVCGYDTGSEQMIRTHVTRRHPGIPADPSKPPAPEPEPETETPDDGLEKQTANELREYAQSIGINTDGMLKQDLVDAIRNTQEISD